MKIRQSFVSNSSSSSFVIIGFEVGKDETILKNIYFNICGGTQKEINKNINLRNNTEKEAIDELIFYHFRNQDFRFLDYSDEQEEKNIFAKTIVYCDDELKEVEMPIFDIINKLEEFKKLFGSNSEIKIYIGTK